MSALRGEADMLRPPAPYQSARRPSATVVVIDGARTIVP
jgi:hypothetical protein